MCFTFSLPLTWQSSYPYSSSVLNRSLLLRENSVFYSSPHSFHVLLISPFSIMTTFHEKKYLGIFNHYGCTSAKKGWKNFLFLGQTLNVFLLGMPFLSLHRRSEIRWYGAYSPSEVLHSLSKSHDQLIFQQSLSTICQVLLCRTL